MKKIVWVLIILLLNFKANAFSEDWNGIVPCVSTRSDVERKLGVDSFATPDTFGSYKYKGLRVYVDYVRRDKNAPERDLVESIHVYPPESVLLATFTKKVRDFHKDFRKKEFDDRTTHVYGLAVYRNLDKGAEIWVQKNEDDVEVITRFGYFDPSGCSDQSST